HALKAAAIFKGEVRMRIAAHNLGAAELALGPTALRELAQSAGVPFVSANVKSTSDSGGALFTEAVRIATAGSLRIALVGVISPKFGAPGFEIEEPRQAILRTLAAHKGGYDRLIVLAYADDAELEALAKDIPEADAIVG